MPSFEWDDRFSVGVLQIDRHNQYLLNLLIQLINDINDKSDTMDIKVEFEDILDYIVYHFACEEIWMTHTGYGLIHDHQQEHMCIKQKFLNIYQGFQNGNISILNMFTTLSKLIIAHIQDSDTTYGYFASDKLTSKLMTKRH